MSRLRALCRFLNSYLTTEDIVQQLDSGFVYQGPVSTSSANKCLCNTVTYSTLAACAVCQGRGLAIYSYVSSVWHFCTDSRNTYKVGRSIQQTVLTLESTYGSACGLDLLHLSVSPFSRYPFAIPGGTAVPAWAYSDVVVSCPSIHRSLIRLRPATRPTALSTWTRRKRSQAQVSTGSTALASAARLMHVVVFT